MFNGVVEGGASGKRETEDGDDDDNGSEDCGDKIGGDRSEFCGEIIGVVGVLGKDELVEIGGED